MGFETNILDFDKIKDKILEISEVLIGISRDDISIGLYSGKTGIALFFYYLSELLNDQKYSDFSDQLMFEIIEEISNTNVTPITFSDGIAGVGWALEHLAGQKMIDIDTDDVLSEADTFLEEMMFLELEKNNYDFLHGALGIGYYFLYRKNTNAKRVISKLINKLEEISENENGGIKWISKTNIIDNTWGYNISMSHGISSIIAFLSKVINHGYGNVNAFNMLVGSVNYVLSQINTDNTIISSFPSFSKADSNPQSRLAWCYGDLGIASSLFAASNVMKDSELRQMSIDLLIKSTQRRKPNETGIVDAGLCHGASGVALIYSLMNKETNIDVFKHTEQYWIIKALNFSHWNNGFAGYKSHKGSVVGFVNETSLLTGVAGIGLMLISSISKQQRDWYNCLLL